MDFHLDRRLRLLAQSEHKQLYSWAINEVDERGQVIGHDQVPWEWTLDFTAIELVLSDQITVKEADEIERRLSQTAEVLHRRMIRAKLWPGDPRHDDNWFRQTTYRMFGTDRVIKDFRLDILPLESEGKTESCEAWGSVSYSADSDFGPTEDCVIFYLMVKPSTFDRYAQRIASGTADQLILSVGMVSGFYSEWSPSISTRDVKVLARGGEQDVELPLGISFDVPRLGPVGETQLYINAKRVQAEKLPSADAARVEGEQQSTPLVRPEAIEIEPAGIDPQMAKLLASLTSLARWIIGLLVVLIIVTLLTG